MELVSLLVIPTFQFSKLCSLSNCSIKIMSLFQFFAILLFTIVRREHVCLDHLLRTVKANTDSIVVIYNFLKIIVPIIRFTVI
jgi:hypothetical protein